MPQVFGADEIGLISESSLWTKAEFIDDVNEHERALGEAGFEDRLPARLDRSSFHPRGDAWGQHLRSDRTHHTWAIARVSNPETNPNARQTDVGGAKPRYSVEIHAVPINPDSRVKGSVTPVWEGNDIRHFLTGQGAKPGQMTWAHIQRAMQQGPRR